MADRTHAHKRPGAFPGSDSRLTRACLAVWTAVGAVLLLAACIYLLNILTIPVGIVLWTVVLVFVLRGPVSFLEKRGVPRVWGTAAAYVLLFGVIAFIGFIVFSPGIGVSSQFAELVQSVPEYIRSLSAWANGLYSQYSDFLQSDTVQSWANDALGALLSWSSWLASSSASGVVAAGTSVVNTLVTIGFALVMAFWMLIDLPRLGREMRRLVGDGLQDDLTLFHVAFTRVMGGYIKGTVVQCLIIGVGSGALFAVLGVPSPAALGALTGLLNIIPIVGPWLGGTLAAAASVFVSPVAAIAALFGTIAIQQVVYTFISPKIMGESVDIHPALTFIALMAGSALGGAISGMPGALVGALLSIPAVAVMKSLFVYYFEKRTGRRIVASDGVFFRGDAAAADESRPLLDATGVREGDELLTKAQASERAALADEPAGASGHAHARLLDAALADEPAGRKAPRRAGELTGNDAREREE